MMRDSAVRACVADSGRSAAAYLADAFVRKDVRLHTGQRIVVMIGNDGCMSRGQSMRLLVYRMTAEGYREVFDAVSMPEQVTANRDGTLLLATHETIDTIFEAVYVWNGTTYAFSAGRSHIYDVPLETERPYEMPVRFKAGSSSTVLDGSSTTNFGQTYTFLARAGQHLTIEILNPQKQLPAVFLSLGDRRIAELDGGRWSGTLPSSGTYTLDVFGPEGAPEDVLRRYAIRLTIR
jgi:hypothetical protein